MPRVWTPQQQDAITARGGSLLVSAAAGSGKTAVLTERIIRRITDQENPVDADRFLVVTFTRAAAAEMRTRVADRLRELIRQNPGSPFLQRQALLLQQAQICTIDSFLSGLVRENFERLGVPQNLRVVDGAMLSTITADTLTLLLEERFAQPDAGFLALARYFGEENERQLSRQVLTLYGKLRSLPYPFRWMEEQLERYRQPQPPAESGWGKLLLQEASAALSRGISLTRRAVKVAGEDPALQKGYLPVLQQDLAMLEEAHAALELGWDRAVVAVRGLAFGRLGSSKGADAALKEQAALLRDQVKAEADAARKLLCCTEAEYYEDMQAQAPVVESLFGLVKELWQRLDRAKNDAGVADFSDFGYLALRLLADGEGTPTPFAREYAGRFEEILLDEYQDTNQLQDLIFHCVSQAGENLFLVGDLKQSIYRFRSANPQVFMEKRDAFVPYDGARFPALITLSSNFRSRREVTEAVNFVFSMTMSRQVGDVDYDEWEQLNCGASWYPPLPEGEKAVSLMLVDLPREEGEDPRLVAEARAVAAKIREMILSGQKVAENGALRPCRGGDFVILLRSGRDADQIYASALKEQGVDALLGASEGYFGSREVSLMVSLLRVLDNPTLDIPMAAVLLSPVFGFSCDQVAALSLDWPDQSLYGALIRQSNDANGEKAAQAAAFLSLFDRLREKSASMSVQSLIQYIYDATDFVEVMNRFSDAAGREANLKLLLKYAGDYAAGGNNELSGFVAYLDALMERGEDFEVANPMTESENAVQIMTIHRSKGLEFPFVVLANCGKRHNLRDLSAPVAMDPGAGFGMKRVERDKLQSFPTLPLMAIHCQEKRDLLSEEMRLLYVAMTRAKERLLLVCGSEKMDKDLLALASRFEEDGSFPPESAALATRYSDWLLPALLRHPSCRQLRSHYQLAIPEAAADFPLEVSWVRERQRPGDAEPAQEALLPDPQLVASLKSRFAWQYPHLADTITPAKTAVTRIAHPQLQMALPPPAFARESGFTPAQRGSIFHRALQFSDFKRGAFDPEEELSRLVKGGWLSPAEGEAIDFEEFAAFFQSPLMGRMLRADQLLREYRFFDSLPAAEAGFEGEGEILIQGIADCVLLEGGRAVIVDFKTDRVSQMEQLCQRYSGQLAYYRRALEKAFPGGVSQCLIYSTCLKQTISV